MQEKDKPGVLPGLRILSSLLPEAEVTVLTESPNLIP
jgi:hypothetical protein